MAGENILIVDDDRNIVRFLELELLHEGYSADMEYDGVNALRRALNGRYDLILLDVMLPGMSGTEVLKRLRATSDTPVILLTAKDTVPDKVAGFESGADDYLTKPFAIEELLARIRVALKRKTPISVRETIMWGPLTVSSASRRVDYAGETVELTKREFDLLFYLLSFQNIVCSRERLMEEVWGYDFRGETNLVDVYVRYLRNKLDYRFGIELVQTIRGVGYIVKSYEKT